ncbi:hypothetical protein [Mycobacterium sp.]
MIDFDLDTEHSILQVQPEASRQTTDFVDLAKAVEPWIRANADLAGVKEI